MRTLTSLIVLTAALSAVASPAAAQASGTSSSRQRKTSTPKPPPPPLPKPKINIRAFGAIDAEAMSAHQTFQAVTGSSVVLGYGGGAEIVNLWSRLFVRGDYTTGTTNGTRAFVVDNSVVSTGIPLSVRLSTTELAGGWRMPMRKHPKYTPYAGAAYLLVHYAETSDFATDAENVSDSFTGYSVLGGVDIQLHKRWHVTGEAQYRFVPNAIGDAGVSQVYGESDLGGFVGRAMFGFNFRK